MLLHVHIDCFATRFSARKLLSYKIVHSALVQCMLEVGIMKILIVEDDAVIGLIAHEWLEHKGHEVVGPAFTATEALTYASEGTLDLAFVDINLEGHDEGIELARTLRDNCHVPCIFVSGQSASARANRDAAVGFLCKPYSLEELARSALFVEALARGEGPPPPDAPASLEVFNRKMEWLRPPIGLK